MGWETEYPSVATVNQATFATLQTWDVSLPPAQTDVEHTIRRKIKAQLFARAGEQVREKAPDIADKWNSIMDKIDAITAGKSTMRM